MEDMEILELYFSRSESAIGETEKKFGNYLSCIAQNILGCREDSEETVSDAYLAAWNSIPPARPQNLAAYLGKLVRNKAIKKWRENNASKRGGGETDIALDEIREFVPSGNFTGEIDERIVITDVLNRFLEGLTKEKRIIFIRRYWMLYSLRSIADGLGISEGKVKSVLFRLRKQLKELLESEGIYL